MLKNIKSYYLYFFSLIFSVTLFFAFKTLQYNEDVANQLSEGSSASTGFEVATYMLYFIILVFVLYANKIFMNRRSREIGLYQLIGMSKWLIFRLIAIENIILFGSAVVIGIGAGFITSRLFALILLKIIDSSFVVGLSFNFGTALYTIGIFALMLVIILVQLLVIIKKHSLLEMFQASKKADETVRKFSVFHFVMGIIGLLLISYGYYQSTMLFEGNSHNLLIDMLVILGTTIGGTYLVFRYSVALIINLWRKAKNGFLSRSDVIALTPIMHRMKSNSKSLTLIAILTALSLGINTLAYISYYTIDKMTVRDVPADFIVINGKDKDFKSALDQANIKYEETTYEYIKLPASIEDLLKNPADIDNMAYDITTDSRIIPDPSLKNNEAVIYNFNNYSSKLLELEVDREIMLAYETPVHVKALEEESVLVANMGLTINPVIAVSNELYQQLKSKYTDYEVINELHLNLKKEADFEKANSIYKEIKANIFEVLPTGDVRYIKAQKELRYTQMQGLGLSIFITAFLGLAFLFASGSILYFKQMTEADLDSPSFTILRKIGYSENDLMHGVYRKQLFNFGVPIIIGLLHSYFAVKSGWWFFGTEYGMPMLTMMGIYVVIYILFALMTVSYYRIVVKKAL